MTTTPKPKIDPIWTVTPDGGLARTKPMTRKGKPCKVLPDGAPRRMSDGKNAYRKMNAEQRETFLAWIAEQDRGL